MITGTRPTLTSPSDNTLSNTQTLTVTWAAVTDAGSYEVQFDTEPNLETPDYRLSTGNLTQQTVTLPDGTWYWRVRGLTVDGTPGEWSETWKLIIDTVAPEAPSLLAPANGTSSTDPAPYLSWTASEDATTYELWLYAQGDVSLPVDVGSATGYTPATLAAGTYEWQVRASDAAGNHSFWSAPNTFTVLAEPEPQVTRIEAESAHVQQTGTWTLVNSTLTSGEQYVMSSGQPSELLTLRFTGSRVNVVYVQGAALGTFTILVDGEQLLTVDSADRRDDSFTERVSISLDPGEHVLRIVADEGVVALDVFEVTAPAQSAQTNESAG